MDFFSSNVEHLILEIPGFTDETWANSNDMCPRAEIVTEFKTNTETLGTEDNTGVNAFKLKCLGGQVMTSIGYSWGEDADHFEVCPGGYSGVKLRMQQNQVLG